jgi:hypothetical protein
MSMGIITSSMDLHSRQSLAMVASSRQHSKLDVRLPAPIINAKNAKNKDKLVIKKITFKS